MRYRITVEYDGTPFVGWQRQDNGPSVQGALEEAILKISSESVTVTGAGRTDAGVHALGQVAHFDLVKEFAADKIRDGLNHFLRPAPVVVIESRIVDAEFHARFSATGRHYLYRILCRRSAARAGDRPRLACRARPRCGGDAPRGTGACWPA